MHLQQQDVLQLRHNRRQRRLHLRRPVMRPVPHLLIDRRRQDDPDHDQRWHQHERCNPDLLVQRAPPRRHHHALRHQQQQEDPISTA